MRSKKTENVEGSSRKQGSSRKVASLDSRYGEIGISAVAAALQYSGDVKSAAELTSQQDDRWHADLAA
jgi:hypothetical protein